MTEGRRVGEQEIKEAMAYADGLFSQQRFEEASKIYSDVAREIEFQFGEDLHANRSMANHPAIPVHIYALQKLGDCLHGTSQLRDCIPVYERVVRAKSRFQTGFDNDYADMIMKIARTYEQLGNYNESKNTYEEALMLVRGALGFEHPLFQRVHQAYENLSNKIDQRKKIADALKSAFSDTDISSVASSIASGVHNTPPGFSIDPSQAPSAATGGVQYPSAPSGRPAVISTPLQIPEPTAPPSAQTMPGPVPTPTPAPMTIPIQIPVQSNDPVPQAASESMEALSDQESAHIRGLVQGITSEPIPPAIPGFNQEGPSPFVDFGHSQMNHEPRKNDPAADPYINELAAKVNDLKQRRETQEVAKPAFPQMIAPEEAVHNPDPYMDHLAARVAELRAQVSNIPSGVKKASQSGIWNLADLAAEMDITSAEGVSWRIQESTSNNQQVNPEAVKWEVPSVEEIKLISHRETLSPEVPVDKTSARKATIKGEKLSNSIIFAREYMLALVVVVGLIFGGMYLFRDQKPKSVQLGSGTQALTQSQGKSQTYISGDGKLSLSVGANDLSTYQDEKSGIQVPMVLYNNPLRVAQQWIDSVMERQLWFSRETQENICTTENGVKLYSVGSPELKVAADAKNWYIKIKQAYANPKNTAAMSLKLPANVSIKTVTEVNQQDAKDHLSTLLTGQLLIEESRPGPLEIHAYLFHESADKAPIIYVRATDGKSRWIGTKNSGQALVYGSDPELLQDKNLGKVSVSVPPKPTKVWIGDNISMIIYFIHYWVPLFLSITGGALLFAGNKKDIHAVSVAGYVVLFFACLAAIAQYIIWM